MSMNVSLSTGVILTYIPDFSHIADEQKELWQEWIKALRSGGYVQGYNGLKGKDRDKNTYAFCCLGVLCDVLVKKEMALWGERQIFSNRSNLSSIYSIHFDGGWGEHEVESALLPEGLVKLSGLARGAGFSVQVASKKGMPSLADLNDDKLATFSDIADILQCALNGGIDSRRQE